MGNKLRIFILEDNQYRISDFETKFSDFDLVIAKSFDEAITKLNANIEDGKVFDYMFLDHDLSDEDYNDQNRMEKNGTEFSKIIKDFPIGNPTIIIHSLNQPGANRMLNNLKSEYKTSIIRYTKLWDLIQIN